MGQRSASIKSKGRVQDSPPADSPAAMRWWARPLLLLLSIALLTFAFAPFNQFYLAWVALVPWLIVLRHCRSIWTAFLWSWLWAAGFFIANMWWLAYLTGAGMAGLIAVLALYWGTAGAVIQGARLLKPGRLWVRADANDPDAKPCPGSVALSVFLIACVWTSLEWFRATWPLGGLAWAFLGHTQSPVLHLCQIADFAGVYGITFWVVLLNAVFAFAILNRKSPRTTWPAGLAVLGVMVATLGYGVFRFNQHTTRPGPTVLVVQPDYPQDNSGEKGAGQVQIVDFHMKETREALAHRPGVNLVVWSETMMPSIDPEALRYTAGLPSTYWHSQSKFLAHTADGLVDLARQDHTCLLTGGVYYANWTIKPVDHDREIAVPLDRRNSAYFVTPAGISQARYDKIHLVPFGEFLPFKQTVPPLYSLFLAMSPYTEEYTLTSGPPDVLTAFELKPGWRFVTPICFEDMDGNLVRRMFDGPDGKRADFIVNITNDGWFKYNEMPQHLQAASFRSIENRAPTARSVNTGVSGFIDSMGRISNLIPAGTEGTSVATLTLDDRHTFYTRFGDLFAYVCMGITLVLALGSIVRWGFDRAEMRRT